jgi:hypothetical protein
MTVRILSFDVPGRRAGGTRFEETLWAFKSIRSLLDGCLQLREGCIYSVPLVTRLIAFFDQPIERGRAMLLSLAYLVIRMILRLLVPDGQGEAAKDLEIVVLRHELNVLRRQIKRPLFRPCDRPILAAAARRLPRAHWDRFLVTPKTLLRGTGSWSASSGLATATVPRAGPRYPQTCGS